MKATQGSRCSAGTQSHNLGSFPTPPLGQDMKEDNYIGGVRGNSGAGGDLGPWVRVGGLVRVLYPLAIAKVFIRGDSVVVVSGYVIIVPDSWIILLARNVAGLGHRGGFWWGLGLFLGAENRERQSGGLDPGFSKHPS